MKKTILLFLLMIIYVSSAMAQTLMSELECVLAKKNIVAAGYDDIIYHLSCDDNTSPTPEKYTGSGTVNVDAGILLNTTDEQVGTGCFDQNNDGFDDFDFTVASNIDFSSGRLGFYANAQELASNSGVLVQTVGDDFRFRISSGTQQLTYLGSTQNLTAFSGTGSWVFVEFKFDGTTCTLYVDGSSVGSATGSGSVDDTTISFGAQDGNAWDMLWDNIIASNDPDRDLNAVKDVTDFS